jgi:hypothetical protein
MAKFSKKCAVLVCATLGLFGLTSAYAAGGAYVSNAVLKNITIKNTYFITDFAIVGVPPSTGKITTVNYTWSYATKPTGLAVYLCQYVTNACVDVTTRATGSTTYFANKSPTNKFYIRARVNGTGTMSTVAGQNSQVIVNWQ